MASEVYFANTRANSRESSLLNKVNKLFNGYYSGLRLCSLDFLKILEKMRKEIENANPWYFWVKNYLYQKNFDII